MYKDGHGVKKDYKQAVKWYRLAAEQGLASAQLNLGAMYVMGSGVDQDNKKAYKWWIKAARQGHSGAKKNLNRLCKQSPWACDKFWYWEINPISSTRKTVKTSTK